LARGQAARIRYTGADELGCANASSWFEHELFAMLGVAHAKVVQAAALLERIALRDERVDAWQ
jgi:hypothetical protein